MRNMLASLRGDGKYSISVPPMDGALNSNNALEDADIVANSEVPDNLWVHRGKLLFSAGAEVRVVASGASAAVASFDAPVTSLAAHGDALAAALESAGVVIRGGPHDGVVLNSASGRSLDCVTAMAFDGPDILLVCIGSETLPPAWWKHDLMHHGRSGSVWRAHLREGTLTPLARELGFSFGGIPVEGGALVAESWRHRLVLLREGPPAETILSDLPAYPARLTPALGGGA